MEGDVMRRIIVIALSVILALMVAAPLASATQVGPPSLSAQWWQWALEKSAKDSPINGSYNGGTRCNGEKATGYFFLAGGGGGKNPHGKVVRDCTAPAGEALYFPLVNNVCTKSWIPSDGANEQQLRDKCTSLMTQNLDGASMFATINGKDILNLSKRQETGLFTLNPPADNVFAPYGLPAGQTIAYGDGVYVTVPAPAPGQYNIHFGGTHFPCGQYPLDPSSPPSDCFFSQDITYHLEVVNK
jgi:hypothetical protein